MFIIIYLFYSKNTCFLLGYLTRRPTWTSTIYHYRKSTRQNSFEDLSKCGYNYTHIFRKVSSSYRGFRKLVIEKFISKSVIKRYWRLDDCFHHEMQYTEAVQTGLSHNLSTTSETLATKLIPYLCVFNCLGGIMSKTFFWGGGGVWEDDDVFIYFKTLIIKG